MSPRIAGDDSHYEFRLCRIIGGVKAIPTQWGFRLPSSTTIIKDNLAIPPGAMAWWGFRDGLASVSHLFDMEPAELLEVITDPEKLEEHLKAKGFSPNMSRDAAGDRGSKAHLVLECLAEDWKRDSHRFPTSTPGVFRSWGRVWAEALAMDEEFSEGTRYGWAAIEWWDKEIQPNIDSGDIVNIISEVPVFSLEDLFAGTLDLGIEWAIHRIEDVVEETGWEIVDAKTHKPASGYTKEGSGPGYDSDAAQIRSYRKGVEEAGARPDIFISPFPAGAKTIGQRTVILRDRSYRGSGSYLEDFREVPYEMFKQLREVNDHRAAFEGRTS